MRNYRMLKEWVDANGNKATTNNTSSAFNIPTPIPDTGYKEKFQKLLDYHKKHVGSDVIFTEIRKLNNYGFEYKERRLTTTGISETIVEVDINDDGEWYIYVWQDGFSVAANFGKGFEDLLNGLSKHLKVPGVGSAEYQKLLEWVDSNGNKTDINKPANDLFKDRFIKLAKHIEDCHSWSLVNYMSEWELDLEFYYRSEAYSLDIDVNSVNIQVIVYNNDSGVAVVNATVGHNEWSKVLSILETNNVIKDKKLCEWVDDKGNKISFNKPAVTNQTAEVVYIWDMYIDPRDKGTWCSAEKYHGEYDGCVYVTGVEARRAGWTHLCELEDEGELRGDSSDYSVEAVAIPKVEVSDYTLEVSGLQ